MSAVVPTHNSPHIEACLASILHQSETELTEVVVVDDASTDDTVARVLKVSSSIPSINLHVIRLDRNRGPSAAKNAGVARAKGTHIAAIDSDVVLEEDCLKHLAEDMQASEASAAMAYFQVPKEIHVLTRVIGYDLEFRLSRILDEKNWVEVGKVGTGATLFMKGSLVEAGLFDESRRVGEDTALSYRMREMGRKLIISRRAKCWHYWQSRGLLAYVRQQVGYGEGIVEAYLDSHHMPSDPVSGPLLRLNALLAGSSVVALLLSPIWNWLGVIAIVTVLTQMIIDLPPSIWILTRKRDSQAGFIAPFVFLVRNYSWAASIVPLMMRIVFERARGGVLVGPD